LFLFADIYPFYIPTQGVTANRQYVSQTSAASFVQITLKSVSC